MSKMSKQTEAVLNTSSHEIVQQLQTLGESITTICKATGMSRSQVSLVSNGKRSLTERYYRELVKMAIDRGIF